MRLKSFVLVYVVEGNTIKQHRDCHQQKDVPSILEIAGLKLKTDRFVQAVASVFDHLGLIFLI
jgi:hypothetical protein